MQKGRKKPDHKIGQPWLYFHVAITIICYSHHEIGAAVILSDELLAVTSGVKTLTTTDGYSEGCIWELNANRKILNNK